MCNKFERLEGTLCKRDYVIRSVKELIGEAQDMLMTRDKEIGMKPSSAKCHSFKPSLTKTCLVFILHFSTKTPSFSS